MKHKFLQFALFFLIVSTSSIHAQTQQFSPDIQSKDLKHIVSFLASDELKGRMTGSAEDLKAAEYIRDYMRNAKLKPLAEGGFQHFYAITDVKPGKNNSLSAENFVGKLGVDFNPVSFSANASLEAGLVFVGYGYNINKDSLQWNDYKNVDVKGKWVMIMRGDPEPDNMASPYMEYSQERFKVNVAKEQGAAGVIFITGRIQQNEDKLPSVFFDKTLSDAGIPVISVTRGVAEKLFEKYGKSFIETEVTISNFKQQISFETGYTVKAQADVEHTKVRTQNVCFLLEGNDSLLKKEYLVIGAHFDHLGMGGKGSGSRMPDTVAVHNGADDNASGVAAIMELASAFSFDKKALKRSIIFVAFSGEEMGMLGSKEFIKNSPVPLPQIKAMINFDMIGRLRNDSKSVSISGTGTAKEWEEILNKYKTNSVFDISFSPDGYGPSDHAPFYAENIPVLFITTGAHEDYHTPFDDTEKLDFKSMEGIISYAKNVITHITDAPAALTFQESGTKEKNRMRGRLKVTLGIIPDVAGTTKNGLGVDGVKKDGPAEKGGMKKGDVIIAMDGHKIGNVYDYMFQLSKLESGKITIVEVLRNGKKEVLLVQP